MSMEKPRVRPAVIVVADRRDSAGPEQAGGILGGPEFALVPGDGLKREQLQTLR